MKIRLVVWDVIRWLNWSALKRSFLIGSLSGPNFPIWTAKMDGSRKISINRALEKHERQFCMKSRPCSCFLAYNNGKKLCENDTIKIVCFFLSSL